MSQKIILIESRVSDFRNKFSNKFSLDQLEKIINEIPSKYYLWAGKNLDQISFNNSFQEIKQLLDYFEKFGSNFPKTDLNTYSNLNELKNAASTYSERQRRNPKKANGANVVVETPKYYVVNPLSSDSSCYYGKGTKWCTTGLNASDSFNRYNSDGKIFYIIDKTLPNTDPYYKIAMVKKFDGDESWWDALDEPIRNYSGFSTPEFTSIITQMNEYFKKEYAGQIKVEEDKKRAKFEAERSRKIEQQRIRRGKEAEGESRREDQEWAMTPNLSKEGQKAWALLQHLENDGADVRNREQEERLNEIQVRIDDLNAQYDAAPETDTDLLDQISELEDEKEEILSRIDVYYLIPLTQDHYGNQMFEVIHDDFYGQTYAVGTEDEMAEAAENYVRNLIDDIGIAGFNKSFYSNYIDTEAVEQYARNIYEDDVYQNPDVYFDDSERMLSSNQNDEISRLKFKIAGLRDEIERLEELSNESEDDDEIDRIEKRTSSLEERIDDLENEIEEIEESPEGDFPDALFDEKIDDQVEDAMRDPEGFLENHAQSLENFIDEDEFVEAVVEQDGYDQLSSYDGTYEIWDVMGTQYYVYRID